MPRSKLDEDEAFEALGRSYLSAGRIVVARVGAGGIEATCRGRRATYRLGFDTRRGWWCDCRVVGPCQHLFALRLVTDASVVRREASDVTRGGAQAPDVASI